MLLVFLALVTFSTMVNVFPGTTSVTLKKLDPKSNPITLAETEAMLIRTVAASKSN